MTKALTTKALCYIVDDGRLLVMRHVDAPPEEVGLQVPGGTVRPGEDPVDAALREAREETGLADLTVVGPLGVTEYDISPYRSEIQMRHFVALRPTAPTPDRWASSEDDPSDGGGPIRLECLWIPLRQGHVLQSGQGALLHRLVDAGGPGTSTGRE